MTSKLTRERIELIANFHRAMALPPSHAEIEELARIALAAMDSEPHTDDELSNLLWYSQEATCHSDPNYYCEFQRLATPGLIAGIIRELQERRKADSESVAEVLSNRPGNGTSIVDVALPVGTQLYLHAQTAPALPLPDVVSVLLNHLEDVLPDDAFNLIDVKAWNAVSMLTCPDACRAAMLQAEPVCTCPSGNGSLRWPCPVHPGNNPEIPDAWIPVSERMPDENAEQQVLACFKGGDISTLYYFEGRWDDAYGIVPIRQDVTHWMPLPAAPREGK
ncbi:DUF551 domain-containing protein [Klebsiella pneumoniae]|uniref:DUF551 domain-containing protein n=1 Tax=Klebsiella pneumoniae TaxID=573 RepID=UPI001C7FD2D7|nr:DUF551 domain-containing protein [Klebsiella pneumoniae]MBX4490415.1 DUF551 domain-containing protein [Klebsiella pneumoniae]MBX4495171.1 hypothetical protein [Klebsiella pneumoniae]